jgi:tetratricopeptide (TPR) repeat protein
MTFRTLFHRSFFCIFLLIPFISTALPVPLETGTDSFEDVSRKAAEALESNRLEEAISLYRRAVELSPAWVEGWWYLGTIQYDLDRYLEARDAFRRFVSLEPDKGPGWAFLGLCEFQVREYHRALEHLGRARLMNLAGHVQLMYVTNYHAALLYTRFEQFELSFSILANLALNHAENPRIIEALGLSTLRMPYLPMESPPDRREAILKAGRAATFAATHRHADAQKEYDELVERYPRLPNVHYARGVFRLVTDPAAALEDFKKEIEISPSHVPARLQMAYEYLKLGELQTALPYAQEAVRLQQGSFVARNALGRILLDMGEVERSVEELEAGVRLAPDSPEMHFALARAYARAGKREESQKSRSEFLRLDKLRREQRQAAQPVPRGVETVPEESAEAQP